MNTAQIGDISEAMVAAALLKKGYSVLKPAGNSQRYDLVIDDEGTFKRVQVKTGRLKNGAIMFQSASRSKMGHGVRQPYHGQIEFFGVYCPENNETYLVPIPDGCNTNIHLRVHHPKMVHPNIRWAAPYRI